MNLYWTGEALDDLSSIQEYIAQDSQISAARVIAALFQYVEEQLQLPRVGRPGRVAGTHELVIPKFPYVVPYRIVGNDVHVLRVFHTSRLWPDML